MMNKCLFIGNLGRDPDIRTMNSGERVANLSLGVTEKWRDKASGERKERTEWVRVVVFNENLVKLCENYLRKGSQVFVEGSMQTRKYEQGGVEKYSTEIILQKFRGEITMLGGRSEGQSDESFSGGGEGGVSGRGDDGDYSQSSGFGGKESYDLNDEIPF